MIKKTLKYGGIAIVCLIIVTLASALLYRKYLQHEVSEARAICARFIVRRWSSLPTRSGKNVRVERLAPRRSISPSSTIRYPASSFRPSMLPHECPTTNMESVAPYPPAIPDMNKTGTVRDWESSLLGPPPSETGFTNVKRILRTVISAPEYSIADDIGFVRGQTFSLQVMMPQMMEFDLTKLGPSFREPLFFFEGRIDPYCPGSVIADYVQTINACATEGDCVV